jgi:alkanesulfonate monooxygenase SsuD/methylene tetrahydromethanopterin reductase-like flavin-dependent oxidoreductase (luciferase family)
MDFSIRPVEGGQSYDEALEQVIRAEELGYYGVYLAEHYGWGDLPYWPSAHLGHAGFATRTSTIRLGTAITLLPLANPLRLASEIAFLDVISNGRTVFGLGVGWREAEFDALGVPYSERGKRMTEYLQIINEVFENSPASFDGEFYQFSDFELAPQPVQSKPELLVGGTVPAAYKRATKLADGWISPAEPLENTVAQVEEFQEAGGGRKVIMTRGLVVRESTSEARKQAKDFIRLRQSLVQTPRKEGNPHATSGIADNLDEVDDVEVDLDEYIDDRLWIVGDPDDCIEQVQRIVDRTDADELLLIPSRHSAWGQEKSLETLRLFGTEVMPSF